MVSKPSIYGCHLKKFHRVMNYCSEINNIYHILSLYCIVLLISGLPIQGQILGIMSSKELCSYFTINFKEIEFCDCLKPTSNIQLVPNEKR